MIFYNGFFCMISLALSLHDLRDFKFPRHLLDVLCFTGLSLQWQLGRASFQLSALNFCMMILYLLLIRWSYERLRKQEGFGMGDIYLLAIDAIWFGFLKALWILIIAAIVACMVQIILKKHNLLI